MSVPIFLTGTLQVLKGFNNISSEPSFLQPEHPQLFQPFLAGEVLQSFNQQQSLLWTCSSTSMSFLCWGHQSWMQHCTGFSSEQTGGQNPLPCPACPQGFGCRQSYNQDMIVLLGCECTLRALVQPFTQQGPKSFSRGLFVICSSLSLCCSWVLPQHRCRPLHSALESCQIPQPFLCTSL